VSRPPCAEVAYVQAVSLTRCILFAVLQQSIDTGLEPIAETAAPYVNNTYNTPAKTFEHLYHHYHHFEARGTADSKDLDSEEPALSEFIVYTYLFISVFIVVVVIVVIRDSTVLCQHPASSTFAVMC
jgi:hypothetical protein